MLTADLHSHLLPGIDDGAQSVEQTASLLRTLSQSGIKKLALTPHFYPSRQSLESFLRGRAYAYGKILALPEAENFTFSLGAEVYFTEQLFNNEDLSSLCYEGTNFLLTELETKEKFTSSMERNLLRLMDNHGIVPVLAHIERYGFLISDEGLLSHLKQMGCLFQMNLSSFSAFFFRKKILSLAQKGYLDFFGGDVHRQELSPKKQKRAAVFLETKGSGIVERAEKNAGQIFKNTNEAVK